MRKNIFKKILSIILTLSVAIPASVLAASLSDISDEMSSLKKSTVSSHEIMFVTPSGVQYDDTVILTFQSDFVIGDLEVADVDLDENSGSDCSAGTWTDLTVADSPGVSTWGVATTSSAITFTAPSGTSGQITAGRCMRVQLGASAALGSNEITNTTTSGSKTISFSGTFGDTGTATVEILDDDQVAVTAEVLQAITFSISANAINFGNLSSTNDRYADATTGSDTEVIAHTFTAGTNASSGYSITVQGATLTSGGNTITAIGATHAATSLGAEQFGIRITAADGSGAVLDPYDDVAEYAYGADAGTTDVVASASGSTADTVYSARYLANIASDTEAGSYTTALTYVATANF